TVTFTQAKIDAFADLIDDHNPWHVDKEFACKKFPDTLVHGAFTAAFVSTVLASKMPGFGTIFAGLEVKWPAPTFCGDTMTVTLTLATYDVERGKMIFDVDGRNQNGIQVLTGKADARWRPPAS